MRLVMALTGLVLLAGCAADQGARVPPDPDAPFPLANARIVGHPSPGTLLVEQRDISVSRLAVERAARSWCGGPASVSPIQIDRNSRFMTRVTATWLVRCA